MPTLPASLVLEDDEVRLRTWRMDDAPALEPMCGDPDVCRFSSVPWQYERSAAERWIAGVAAGRSAGAVMALAITKTGIDDLPLGNVNLVRFSDDGHSAALGYWLAPGARGRGLATRAARLMCSWGFEALGLAEIELAILPENRASQRVAGRLGAVPQGLRRDSHRAEGRWWNMEIYVLGRPSGVSGAPG
jgi:ribosomal-protein-alanine N-acetyltransferase